MAYEIDRTDKINYGSITVADQSVNQETSLSFVGKNYTGYASSIAENFLHLLENFAAANPPTNPIIGQLWYDTNITSNPPQPQLKVWDGTKWVAAGNITKKTVRPTTGVIGDLWVDTANQQLYLWSGSSWILVGPQFSEGAQSGPKIESVFDTLNVPHTIIEFIVGGEIVAIISKDAFIPKATIEGFISINQGLNISVKDFDGDGIVSNKLWGTADRANKLIVAGYPEGLDANNFLRGDVASLTNYPLSIRNNAGLTFGSDLNSSLTTSNGAIVLYNKTGGSSVFIKTTTSGGVVSDTVTVTGAFVGINNLNPSEALDVTGKIKSSGQVLVNNTDDTPTFGAGSIVTLGGASVAKTLRVGQNLVVVGDSTTSNILPATNNTASIGSNTKRYNTVYATTVGNPDLTTQFRGEFTGAFNGSVTGTAVKFASSTDFKLEGDVTSNTIAFNGDNGGTATFTTSLSSDVITTKPEVLDSLTSDELIVNRVGIGLRKLSKTTFFSNVATVPIGSMMPFAGTTLPPGYLVCDGAEILITGYPELYSVIGNTYKGPEPYVGLATFRLPDLRGRFPMGADNMNNGIQVPLAPTGATYGTTTLDKDGNPSATANRVTAVSADEIGLGSGSEDKSIITNNLPEHTHNLTGANGTQFYAVTDDVSGSAGITDVDAVGRTVQMGSGFSRMLVNSGTVESPQIDVPLNVMNPYLTINYIIYTGRIL